MDSVTGRSTPKRGLRAIASLLGAGALALLVLAPTGEFARAGGRVDARLAPPKAVPTLFPTLGDPKAPVTLMVFGDFQCPYSKMLVDVLGQLVRDQPRKVKVVWRDFPLAFHSQARPAAVAGREVFLQKGSAAFWAYSALVFTNNRNLSESLLLTWAGQVGADVAKVRLALGDLTGRAQKDVERALVRGKAIGVRGTPASFLYRTGTPLERAKQLSGARKLPDLQTEVNAL